MNENSWKLHVFILCRVSFLEESLQIRSFYSASDCYLKQTLTKGLSSESKEAASWPLLVHRETAVLQIGLF